MVSGSGEGSEEAEAVEEHKQAADDGNDQTPVELVAQHGELRVVRVIGHLLSEMGRGRAGGGGDRAVRGARLAGRRTLEPGPSLTCLTLVLTLVWRWHLCWC